ncbi:arginase family protein [Embleya sp. NPDC001921]
MEHIYSAPPLEHMLVVPQWQGSSAVDARRLVAGAHRLSALLPAVRRTFVSVDADPAPDRDGVRQLDVLTRASAAAGRALEGWGEAALFTVGGDCGVELAPIAHAVGRHGDRLAVVWFDAHPDLNTPDTSPSGGFHGMVLRTLLGQGPAALLPPPGQRLSAERLVLAGVRSIDPAEQRFIDSAHIRRVSVDRLDEPSELVAAVAETGATHVYIHVDLDVLDPEQFTALSFPEPEGLPPARLRAALCALTGAFSLAGLGITEHAPAPGTEAAGDPAGNDRVLREIFAGVSAG